MGNNSNIQRTAEGFLREQGAVLTLNSDPGVREAISNWKHLTPCCIGSGKCLSYVSFWRSHMQRGA